MAYSKVTVRGLYSANSDYSEPDHDTGTMASTASPTACLHITKSYPTAGDALIAASDFATVTDLVVNNQDSTNYVTVSYTNAASAAVTPRVLAGKTSVFTDVGANSAVSIAANTSAVVCECLVLGTAP